MRIALRASSGYLTAELGGSYSPVSKATANRSTVGAWETWTVEPQEDGFLALKSCNGFYLCAELGGGAAVNVNRSQVGAWEKFHASGPIDDARSLTLQTVSGQHALSVSAQGEHVVDAVGRLSSFTVEVIDPDPLPPSLPDLTPLHADGADIYAGAVRYVHSQATNYLLFQRFLEGHDLSRLWYDGFDGYNVTFLMSVVPKQAGLRELRPENYARFYERAAEFLQLATSKHKRIEATLLCDCSELGFVHASQETHAEAMYDVLRSVPGHLCQLGNEVEKNGIDYGRFSKPNGVFWSRGSSLAGGPCPLPPGDYSTAHLSRDGGGAYLDAQSYYMIEGYSGYVGTHGPVIVNETRGASNTENSGRRTTDPTYFRKIASAARGWSGMTFHADQGIHSEPFDAGTPQDECRKAFVSAIRG